MPGNTHEPSHADLQWIGTCDTLLSRLYGINSGRGRNPFPENILKSLLKSFVYLPSGELIASLSKSSYVGHYCIANAYHSFRQAMLTKSDDINRSISSENMHRLQLLLISIFKSEDFTRIKDGMRRNHQKVFRSFVDYIRTLRTIYRKLMIIRLDLSYRRDYVSEMSPQLRIESDWSAMLEHIRDNFSDSFAGYGCKFEYGIDKGVHLHTTLFFDGRVVRADERIARILGEHWKQTITQGAGLYFNANAPGHKQKMQHVGVGVLTGDNTDHDAGIAKVAYYVTKPDPAIHLVMPWLTRTFRRSVLTHEQKVRFRKNVT